MPLLTGERIDVSEVEITELRDSRDKSVMGKRRAGSALPRGGDVREKVPAIPVLKLGGEVVEGSVQSMGRAEPQAGKGEVEMAVCGIDSRPVSCIGMPDRCGVVLGERVVMAPSECAQSEGGIKGGIAVVIGVCP